MDTQMEQQTERPARTVEPASRTQTPGSVEIAKGPLWGLLALVAGILVVVALMLSRQMSPTWEYDVAAVEDLEFTATMDRLGEEGWELVSARRAVDDNGDPLYEVILKRPR